MSVILATQEAEIRRITVWSKARQIVCKTLSRGKNPSQKSAGRVARFVVPSSTPSTAKNKTSEVSYWLLADFECLNKWQKSQGSLVTQSVCCGQAQWLKPVILDTWEAEVRTSWFKVGKKFIRPHPNQWLGTGAHICHPSCAGKHK
jgi:hypothetical protein